MGVRDPIATLFLIIRSRGGQVWRDLLGHPYGGILGSDRLSAANRHPTAQRQVCWAHRPRNLRAIEERRGEAGAWANEVRCWNSMMVAIWHAFPDGAMDRDTLEAAMEPVQDAVWACLQRGKTVPWGKAQALSEDMLRLWDGVEPTNNAAEPALHPAVL